MVAKHKKTFTELSESDEKIATNILSCRLKLLEKYKIITKEKSPENKKTNIYKLTDKGLGFTAILLELTFWSIDHIKEFQPNMAVSKAEEFRKDKA
jgi:DNA-binding HxlR family transcriptional regulator